MPRKAKKSPHKPPRAKRSLWTMALAICGVHGVRQSIRLETATDIVSNICLTPSDKMQACAHRTARRAVATDLGLPESQIPESRVISGAIAEYEYSRRMREIWQRCSQAKNEDWIAGFDHHSRQFAIENGVCPRCSAPGDFGPDSGVCECGFSY